MADLSLEANPRFQKKGIPDSIKSSQLESLLHDALVGTNHVQKCAIIKRQDGSVLAASVGFSLTTEQTKTLLEAFKSPLALRENGLFFLDESYVCVRADKTSIYAKKEGSGLAIVRTATLILLAAYSETMYPSICVEATEKLADYFREKGR